MRTPLVVVTGVDPDAMAATALNLALDRPGAVTVQHLIDPDEQVLTRLVGDVTGPFEREEIALEHACVTCALREDVLPTLDRLAGDARWGTIVAVLPVGATADQVDHVLAWDPHLARRLRLTSVVTALDGPGLVGDLLGGHTLRERGRHSSPDDDRGLAEVACAMVEYADLLVVAGEAPATDGVDLVRTLAREDAVLVTGAEHVDAEVLERARHRHRRTVEHAGPAFGLRPAFGRVWQVELASDRPFHPERLLDEVEGLASGPYRSRGSFWLPTRPGQQQRWDGAGGHLSFSDDGRTGRRGPATRIVVTGVGTTPPSVPAGFERLLITPDEARHPGHAWDVAEDGLEPWLGPVRDVA